YGPGAINWSDGVEQAAAYVTINDEVVQNLAREAIRAAAQTPDVTITPRNLANTAAIFDALRALRITYVADPNNPYSRMRQEQGAVDLVQYPRETLARRTGDCDDTSTLVAALLGSVGIDTRFVDAPGHLFLLVDTGISGVNRDALALERSKRSVKPGRPALEGGGFEEREPQPTG